VNAGVLTSAPTGLDLRFGRSASQPKDASTLVLVRDGAGGVEVFCVERHKKSAFLGGAIVFPGGKLDAADADEAWAERANEPDGRGAVIAADKAQLRALAIAACRESLEEAAILPVEGGSLAHAELLGLRDRVAKGQERLADFLTARALRLDLAALRPLSRWITPVAETRRFDTRFFIARAPEGQDGAHDEHETMASFWAHPADLLARFAAGTVELAPPTHRTIELLAAAGSTDAALAAAERACLDPICPELVQAGSTFALVLPGDPEHSERARRIDGTSRFVLRGERWWPEDP
jgi:8-oxo-dGTP pyrophosphatase MutT (NUDIX family)